MKRNPAQTAGRVAVYTALAIMLVIVQLPLLWMILTALKVPGTAFSMQFLPRLATVYPAPDQPALRLPAVDTAAGSWLHLEALSPRSVDVTAKVEQEGATLEAPLVRLPGGRWTGVVGPLKAGTAKAMLVDNNGTQLWPPADQSGAVVIPAGEGVVLSPAGNDAVLYRAGARVVARLLSPGDVVGLELQMEGGAPLVLGADGTTHFAAPTGAAPAGESFRLVERRTLGQALARLYTAENFRGILTSPSFNFARYFLNSIIVAGGAGLLTVLICTLAGYAFATKEFHYRDELFGVLLASMLVPGMIYMVPQFSITLKLGLMNSYAGMIVPHLGNVFGLFLMRQYIGQIPKDLFAAAEIDGAGERQVFQNIVIPVTLPIMVTLFLLTFVGQWSNFLWQLIVNTGDSTVITLPVGLQQFKGQNANEWEKIMAGACFSILPIAALFLALQRYFMEGLTAGAVKE
jgi:multiple sugar transport system permease protein